jgi:Fe-S oxidoreductase
MGFTPYLAAPNQNGKALHVHGYLGAFEKTASKSIRYLNELAEMGIALVGLDPSMTLTYRSEYKGVEAARIKAQVNLVQEWLEANRDRLRGLDTAAHEKRLRLLGHCTERSNVPSSMKQWKSVFQQIGVELDVPETGCCGMAGTFGHEVRNRPISEKLFAASWNGILASSGEKDIVMATGYSCRSQVKAIERRSIRHPVQILNEMVLPL